ncbi:MAG: hypothetical protein M1823_003258 [Watsoniomyces obsoletus]|nr:MAG: hypothetical protein M1823_003258 [Watsoniomyces obsoletus]
MDFRLRCNSLTCRTELTDRAVVTTCSHIFCIPCSESLGRSGGDGDRVCPACKTSLPNQDDAVSTSLNPSEDYKTSVLSGLSPSIIMDCASRALSFWSYQSTQEIVYQEYLARMLREKYNDLNTRMEKVVHDANSEIAILQNKLSAMQLNQEDLQKKTHELSDALREKTRKHNQTQELYNKLKRRTLYSQVQTAASDAVDQSLPTTANVERHLHSVSGNNPPPMQSFQQASGPQPPRANRPSISDISARFTFQQAQDSRAGNMTEIPTDTARPPFMRSAVERDRDRPANQVPNYAPPPRSNQHRQPLPVAGRPANNNMEQLRTPLVRPISIASSRSPTRRQAMSRLQSNSIGNGHSALSGYGLSAGIKVGRHPGMASSPTGPRNSNSNRMSGAFPRYQAS